MPAIVAARSGYEIIRQAGTEAIRARSRLLTARLVAAAQEQGILVRSPLDPDRRGGHLAIDFEGAEPAAAELIRRGFTIDYRPGSGIRIGPHAFNNEGECDAVMTEIRAIRKSAGPSDAR
jgi:kynureninase